MPRQQLGRSLERRPNPRQAPQPTRAGEKRVFSVREKPGAADAAQHVDGRIPVALFDPSAQVHQQRVVQLCRRGKPGWTGADDDG